MKKEKKVIIGIVLILIAGWFYWFQFRPSNIRTKCDEYAIDFWALRGIDAEVSYEDIDDTYQACLARNGLKPEQK